MRARALSLAGTFASLLGRSVDARVLAEEALAAARRSGDQLAIAWCLANLPLSYSILDADDLSQAVCWLEEALGLFQSLGDGWGTSHALRRLGWALTLAGEYERAVTLLQEALALARTAQNKDATAWSLYLLGNAIWLLTMDTERTTPLYEESLSLARQAADTHLLQQVLVALAQTAYASQNYAQAMSRYHEVLAIAREQRGSSYPNWFLRPVALGVAQLAARTGQPEIAAELFGAVYEDVAGSHHIFAERIDVDREITAVREQLGTSRFETAFEQGKRKSLGQAASLDVPIRLALSAEVNGLSAASSSGAARPDAASGLTERETEVLRLIACGKSNKEIAAELVLSVRTVERHITNLYTKIGARGKADATAYALRRNIL